MRRPALSRARRAFSLLEVAAAAALFAVIAIGISLAVGTALANRSAAAIRHELTGKLDLALAELAHAPFDELLDNTFTPPEPCPGAAFRGTEGRSCFTVAERSFEAEWSVSFGVDVVLNATDAASGANIVATAALPDGSTLTRSRRVAAPTPGFTGDGVLRVIATGAYDSFEGVLYLLDADTPTEVVATADMRAYGAALFRAPAAACTTADPCRLGLEPSGAFPSNGTVALAPSAVLGDTAEIVLHAGTTLHRGVEFFTPASVQLDLVAESDTGARAPALQASTICLWLSFNDGAADRVVPSCNDVAAGELRFESYAFDPDHPSFRAPLPPAVEATLSVDHPSGSCPDIGQFGAVAGTFEQLAVCTSWTWGVPETIEYNAASAPFTEPFRIPAGASTRTVVFTGDLARPAVGYGDRPLWQNPRGAGVCADSASCTALLTTAPEDSVCPGGFCLASRVPGLTGPSTGTVFAVAVDAGSTTFDLEVLDPYGDPVQVQLVSAPQSGTLSFDGTALASGDFITTTSPSGPDTVALTFDEDTEIDLVWFTVRLTNTVPDGVRDIDVALYRTARVWSFSPSPVAVTQAGSATVAFTALATDSTPANGETITITAPTGFTAPATVTVGSTGKATFTLTAGSLESGSYDILLTAPGGRTANVPVTVSRSAGSITVVVANLAQGGTTTATATVRDVRGDVMEGANVTFATAATGSTRFATGVRTSPAGCKTDGSGVCTVQLRADMAAPTGAYVLTATTGSASDTDGFTVAATVAALDGARVSVAQGQSVSVVATVRDGTNTPLPGKVVQPTEVPTGFTVGPASRTADDGGEVRFTLTAASGAAPGPHTLTFTVSGSTFDLAFDATATPASVQVESMTFLRGATANGTATILDADGDPVAGVTPSFTSPTGFTFVATPSNAAGAASFTATASSTAPKGVSTVDVGVVGFPAASASFTVALQMAPTSVALLGAVPSAGTAEILATVLDVDGDPVVGAVVELSGTPAAISLPPATATSTDGVATLLLTDTGPTAPGAYRAKVKVSFLDTPHLYSLLVPVVDTALGGPFAPQTLAAPVAAAATASTITLTWSLPADSARTSVEVYQNGTLAVSLAGSATTTTRTALAAESWYAFQIRACSAVGCGPFSTALRARPAPQAPTALAAAASTSGTLDLSWTLPTGSFEGLRLRFVADGTTTTRSLDPSTSTYTLRGLTNGTEYTIDIATLRAGVYSWSTPIAATPSAPPAAPTGFSATVVGSTVQLSWTIPTGNGAALTRVEVYRDATTAATLAASATAHTDSPSAGTYRYAVAACNARGCSPRTPARTVVVP